ncbi:MAG: hypothetical protein K1W19_12745 [Lachnospiraceae bacterium]
MKEVLLLVKKYLHGGMLIMDKELDEKRILQKKIIEMVEKIEDLALLIKIFTFIEAWLEE